MRRLLEFARRHIILALSLKFIAGLVIGFGLGVYYLFIWVTLPSRAETLRTWPKRGSLSLGARLLRSQPTWSAEIDGGCSGDAGEIQGRYKGDIGEMWDLASRP